MNTIAVLAVAAHVCMATDLKILGDQASLVFGADDKGTQGE